MGVLVLLIHRATVGGVGRVMGVLVLLIHRATNMEWGCESLSTANTWSYNTWSGVVRALVYTANTWSYNTRSAAGRLPEGSVGHCLVILALSNMLDW